MEPDKWCKFPGASREQEKNTWQHSLMWRVRSQLEDQNEALLKGDSKKFHTVMKQSVLTVSVLRILR